MHLELVTLKGKKIDQTVYGITLSTDSGEISVYEGHEPLISLAKPGVIAVRYKKEDGDENLDYYASSGGIVHISQHKTRILVDEADHGDDIAESESKAALDRAKKLLESAKDQVELDNAAKLVDRHETRLKVAELRRRRRSK